MALNSRKLLSRPGEIEKRTQFFREMHKNPDIKAKHRAAVKASWEDPVIRSKRVEGRSERMTAIWAKRKAIP